MNDLELTATDVQELDGLLNLVLEGMQAASPVPELQMGTVMVGPTFANIVFPGVEVPVASKEPTVKEQQAVAKAIGELSVIEKGIRVYTYAMHCSGCPLMARTLQRQGDQLVQAFQLLPNNPIGAEKIIRTLNRRFLKSAKN